MRLRSRGLRRLLGAGAMLTMLLTVLVMADAKDGGRRGRDKQKCYFTEEDPQILGINGWHQLPVFTVGETIDGYTPPGILDGIGALKGKGNTVRLLVNHELGNSVGYSYTLASGATLTGARVSYFDIDRDTLAVCGAGLAYDTIYDRAGNIVDDAADLGGGLSRLCSSHSYEKGQFGFKDDLYFTGEETGGGVEYVLDIKKGELWAAPALGRAAWENVTALDTGDKDTIALLVGDDTAGAPLWLYIGDKKSKKKGSKFLAKNGLAEGKLYVWVSGDGYMTPADWNGTGNVSTGQFVEIDYYRPDLAGNGDYDDLGYATQAKQNSLATAAGAFYFSRPEDVATSPFDGTFAAMNSTGRDSLFGGADSWGTIYLIHVDFSDLSTTIAITYDGDDLDKQDFGIRSPDNLDWSEDGYLYVNEDRSIGAFGTISGKEASMWRLDPFFPVTGDIERIAEMNRGAVLPAGQTDGAPGDIGNWESSGVLDVSRLFDFEDGTLLIADVQAHSVAAGTLVEGGQLFFLFKSDFDDDDHHHGHDDDHHHGHGEHDDD